MAVVVPLAVVPVMTGMMTVSAMPHPSRMVAEAPVGQAEVPRGIAVGGRFIAVIPPGGRNQVVISPLPLALIEPATQLLDAGRPSPAGRIILLFILLVILVGHHLCPRGPGVLERRWPRRRQQNQKGEKDGQSPEFHD